MLLEISALLCIPCSRVKSIIPTYTTVIVIEYPTFDLLNIHEGTTMNVRHEDARGSNVLTVTWLSAFIRASISGQSRQLEPSKKSFPHNQYQTHSAPQLGIPILLQNGSRTWWDCRRAPCKLPSQLSLSASCWKALCRRAQLTQFTERWSVSRTPWRS